MEKYALNIFNLPLAGHDGDADTQVSSIDGPPLPPGTVTRGQLESSLRTRAQLEREGFACKGDADSCTARYAGDLSDLAEHRPRDSPLVRQRLDAFLKRNGATRGRLRRIISAS
jgi:hypothetical protein